MCGLDPKHGQTIVIFCTFLLWSLVLEWPTHQNISNENLLNKGISFKLHEEVINNHKIVNISQKSDIFVAIIAAPYYNFETLTV